MADIQNTLKGTKGQTAFLGATNRTVMQKKFKLNDGSSKFVE